MYEICSDQNTQADAAGALAATYDVVCREDAGERGVRFRRAMTQTENPPFGGFFHASRRLISR